jgi:hypothetical protein
MVEADAAGFVRASGDRRPDRERTTFLFPHHPADRRQPAVDPDLWCAIRSGGPDPTVMAGDDFRLGRESIGQRAHGRSLVYVRTYKRSDSLVAENCGGDAKQARALLNQAL